VRRQLLVAAGTLVAVAGAVTVLALAGAFSGEDGDGGGDERAPSAPSPEPSGDRAGGEPEGEAASGPTTLRIGGQPTALAAGGGVLWVADSFAPRGAVLESERAGAEPTPLDLGGAASDVAAGGDGAFFALPEQGVVERRALADPGAAGEAVRLRGFPSAVAAGEGTVWALSDRSVERIDPGTAEVTGETPVGGFGSSLAAGEGGVWVVRDNREVTRIDPDSGEATERTVTRLDPDTLEPLGKPLRVGDEPASVTVGEQAVWVANGGDGTVTRIEP
jgi:hypothetical protein